MLTRRLRLAVLSWPLALLFLPLPALAAETSPAADLQSQLTTELVKLAVAVLAGLAGWASLALKDFLRARAEAAKEQQRSALLFTGLEQARALAEAVVADVAATVRPQLEKALEDHVLTEEERKQLRDAAWTRFTASLGEHGKAQLGAALGLAGDGLKVYVMGLVEQSVLKRKATEALVDASSQAAPVTPPAPVLVKPPGGQVPTHP